MVRDRGHRPSRWRSSISLAFPSIIEEVGKDKTRLGGDDRWEPNETFEKSKENAKNNQNPNDRTAAPLLPLDINWVTLSFNGTLINVEHHRKPTTPALIQMNSLASVLLRETTNKSVTVGPFK